MEELTPRRRESDRPRGRMRKGMYILPSLFTTANIAAGFFAILETVRGSIAEPWHLDFAAMAIGFAVFFDGLDGRIARMTHTESDFGKELDSLADVITFGVAPALLAWMWGFHMLPATLPPELRMKVTQLGTIACFVFLMAGASRLARFNITSNPQPSNPGTPGQKIFRRHAHSGRRRRHRRGRPLPLGGAARFLADVGQLAADGRSRRLPDGQHLALLQLQGHRFSLPPSLPSDRHVWPSWARRSGSSRVRRSSPSRSFIWPRAFSGACSGSSAAKRRLHLRRHREASLTS